MSKQAVRDFKRDEAQRVAEVRAKKRKKKEDKIVLLLGLLSEKIQIFVSASLALKLRIYTQNTPIRRNPSSEF